MSWAELILAKASTAETWPTADLLTRASGIAQRLRQSRLGGTWWGRTPHRSTAGHSVVFAAPLAATTRAMLQDAIDRSDAARTILVMPRPGRLTAHCKRLGIRVLDGVVDPWALMEEAACLHATAYSDEAVLARLVGTPVQCHGLGAASLTVDPVQLVAACVLLGARYADPFTGRAATCEEFLSLAEDWRRHSTANADIACCVGVSFWKRRRIGAMLGAAGTPAFHDDPKTAVAVAVRRGGSIAVWPSREPAGLQALANAANVAVRQMEDGFVRSVGLGAEFRPPLSIVLDRIGPYYDATGPSDLEAILAATAFEPALLDRAAALRARMVLDGVTKYNLSGAATLDPQPGRRVVLVPGQVADDKSVLLGGAGARPGLDLLRAVRARCPEAFIAYKPHPDVDAGFRAGALPDADVLHWADQIVRGGSMAALLERVDEVHTLTSLTGFEALLRHKPVTAYGQPFYAGWGLTTDVNPPTRRTRRLTLDALVAGTLILYPRYIDPVTTLPCGPEQVLDRLADPALHRTTPLMLARRLQGLIAGRAQSPKRTVQPMERVA